MAPAPFVCARCIRSLTRDFSTPARRLLVSRPLIRASSSSAGEAAQSEPEQNGSTNSRTPQPPAQPPDQGAEQGALSRRLQEATEEALLTGGRSGRRAVLEESGFSEELKERLLEKVANAQFRNQHNSAFAAAGLDSPESNIVGQGSRDIASSTPWTGTEEMQDAVLRMLTDAHKPLAKELRGKAKIPEPAPVDMRIRGERKVNSGVRAASARDRASAYASMGIKEMEKEGKGLSEKEREEMRKEFRERFTPAARAVPATITGLAALANERIEDAIARGQFKNIPRGKGVERDTRADNPFIDTTEYIMNNMIKRQEIVPPWIEKQQELIKAANVFRSRLRNDWKRHAARMIASGGGSLQEKMSRATEYARAEEVHNPRRRNVDQISVPTNTTDDPVMAKIRQHGIADEATTPASTASQSSESQQTLSCPFRDPTWEATERSYMELAINNLNAITRSYNLMAPELAKKPYFNLQRELNNCFADVAPQLANEIKERAARPVIRTNTSSVEKMGVLDRFGSSKNANVYDSKAPHYGFKDFWRDLWGRPS